jgi:hypothetical protein
LYDLRDGETGGCRGGRYSRHRQGKYKKWRCRYIFAHHWHIASKIYSTLLIGLVLRPGLPSEICSHVGSRVLGWVHPSVAFLIFHFPDRDPSLPSAVRSVFRKTYSVPTTSASLPTALVSAISRYHINRYGKKKLFIFLMVAHSSYRLMGRSESPIASLMPICLSDLYSRGAASCRK